MNAVHADMHALFNAGIIQQTAEGKVEFVSICGSLQLGCAGSDSES